MEPIGDLRIVFERWVNNVKSLSEELTRYGYVFSMKRSIMLYTFAFVLMLALGRFYSLGFIAQAIVFTAVFLMLPFFIKNIFANRYNQKRFSDLNIYMEQFLYSFQRSGKVLATIEDLISIFEDGTMKATLKKARHHILHTFNEANVEGNALAIIEKEYPYDGLRRIHRFAVASEEVGGDYRESIRLLLEARRMFADRAYALQQKQKAKRREVFLSIITSLILCSMIFMLSSNIGVDISDIPLAQAVTASVLIMDLIIFYLADKKLTVGFVESDHQRDDEMVKTYHRMKNYKDGIFFQRLGKQIAKRRLTREIEKQYPGWMMEISLLLQTENVPVAIQKSYKLAPKVLQPALGDLILGIRENPASMEPYRSFLSEFAIPEVASSMKMLYSISSGAGGDARMQLADMIRRNQQMFDKAKKMENEDSLSGMQAMFLAPQLTGGFKMAVDMALLLIVYMGQQTITAG